MICIVDGLTGSSLNEHCKDLFLFHLSNEHKNGYCYNRIPFTINGHQAIGKEYETRRKVNKCMFIGYIQ